MNLQRTKFDTSSYNETRSRMLWVVQQTWERLARRFQGGRDTSEMIASRGGVRGTEAIAAKLKPHHHSED